MNREELEAIKSTEPITMKNQEAPRRLSQGYHLFIDDYLIEQSEGLVRTTHQPKKLPQPVIAKAESWHQQPLFFLKVIHEPVSNLFRIWYNIRNPGGGGSGWCYAYAESEDGINWPRPNLGLVEVNGAINNNLLKAGMFLVDDGPGCSEPAHRYKFAFFNKTNLNKTWPTGMWVSFSADGLQFKEYDGNPVIPYRERGGKNIINDIIDGCWDPLRKQYLVGCKIEADGYPGKPHHLQKGFRRVVGQTISKDFINWRKPWFIVLPDPNNGMEEFYGMQPMVRGNLYIGFLRVLRDDLPADFAGPVMGIGWTELITSRDGEHWTRYQEPFIDRKMKSGTWDHAMAWVGDCVTVGGQEYIYYGGYSAGHKIGERQIGLAKLRKNGFVSRDAGSDGGFLRTPLAILDAGFLTVNAKIEGEMLLRVLDEKGKPIPGFDWSDGAPIRCDSVAHRVSFKGHLADLAGQVVRLEFSLRDAQLYGFDLCSQ